MAQETCPSCYGTGGYSETERVPNPAGGIFREIQVRRTCMQCSGVGSIWAPDPASPSAARVGAVKTTSTAPKTPEERDRQFAGLLSLLLGGYMVYVVFGREVQAELWLKWTVVIVPTIALAWALNKYRSVTRFLRYAAIATIVGLALLFIASRFLK